jgi:hypothetical protein
VILLISVSQVARIQVWATGVWLSFTFFIYPLLPLTC